jgi:hypothetical protein
LAENDKAADQPRQRNGQTLLAGLKTVQTACRKSVEIIARESGKMLHRMACKVSNAGLCGSQREAGKGRFPSPAPDSQAKAPSSLTGLFRFWLEGI